MIFIGAALAGAITGGLIARKRGGTGLDIAQYATGYAIAFGAAGIILTIVIGRTLA